MKKHLVITSALLVGFYFISKLGSTNDVVYLIGASFGANVASIFNSYIVARNMEKSFFNTTGLLLMIFVGFFTLFTNLVFGFIAAVAARFAYTKLLA